ncbi:MAG TPA: lamin tail domain-containing protein, partial [Verrucomicrobiota bacterium]|nr:lamin tail domain-containing protein [Verrucomicrobiota bacterium]
MILALDRLFMTANKTRRAWWVRSDGVRRAAGGLATAVGVVLCLTWSVRADVWINEFVADNQDGLRTQAGDAADWVELANNDPQPVDVGGWYLTDRALALEKWRIPDGTTIPANGYLVIFMDSSSVAVTNSELHASFSLSKDGEYLGLVRPDGVTIADEFAPAFPPQLRDIAYGRGMPRERELLGAGAASRYRIPNAGGTAPWIDGTGALGFSSTNGAFTVRYYEMNSGIADVDAAEAMVANSSYWRTDVTYPIVGSYDTIDFHANSSSGVFTQNLLFPNHAYAGQDKDTFVLVAEGAIYVPSAGQWTFAVGSDDGFRLRISGHGVDFVSEYLTGRSFATTLATFNFPVAGVYALSLIYYENYGGASVEFSVAEGFQATFSGEVFHLTGDPAGGILHAGAIGALVETDVSSVMKGVNARLDGEWVFTVDEAPGAGDTFVLYVRCADGFSAALNGTAIGALNAPVPLAWNSAATAARSVEEAVGWLAYSVPASLVVAGVNTLTVTALNNTAADPDFLIEPRLARREGLSFPAYFKTPTPGAANAEAYTAPTPVVSASEPRGYKTGAFTVALSTTNVADEIWYTLDGSVPGTSSLRYAGPLTITQTTVLRAAVVDPETVWQHVTTLTWLFLEDILQQDSAPPPGWPASYEVNNHVMEYGMRQEIVTEDPTRLRQGMTNAIPSISLVTDLANLFSAQRGIYVNPGNDGLAWERPVSVELIDPVQGAGAEFHIDAGLRIRGAYSRSTGNPKHALRLFFRSEYGEGRLRFPLFGEEGASEFDKVDLRTSQNYSWAFENGTQDTFVRETFSRDSQRDMGMPYTRSRYYHLYLNGQYWGLYQTQERGDADYAETYLGGDNDDWDCIKTSQPGYTTTAADGTFDAFYALHDLAINQGFTGATSDNYYRVQGLNPDGTPNPAYPVYLDEENLMVYMLTAYYTGDPDSPVSIWGGFPNNMYGLYNRVTPDGFKWLRHDAEHSLGAHGSYGVSCDTTTAGSGWTSVGQFNPATLHQRLCEHPVYRLRFADLVQEHLYGDGALTPAKARQRFQSRMDEIDLAIIGESARWGRGKTRDGTWLPACNGVLDTYLTQRRDIIVGHFRTRGWFPSIDAPGQSVMNTTVPAGTVLRLAGSGTFYYTTDGSDPRLSDGSINPAAIAVTTTNNPVGPRTLVTRGSDWRYFDKGSEPAAAGGLTWRDPGFADGAWAHGPAILGFAGSSTVNPVATTTRRYVNGVSGAQVTTTYLRHTFTLDSTNGIEGLAAEILRDDGAVVYLNGVEVTEFRENMNPGTPAYATYSAGVVGSPDQNTYFSRTAQAAHLLRVGSNTVAVEVHQCNASSSDLYFDFSLTTVTGTAHVVAEITVNDDVTLKARAYNGSEWSALSENTLTVERPPIDYSGLRIAELMYAPPPPDPESPYSDDDFAWLELCNVGEETLDLEGVRFDQGIDHTFASVVLEPGARLVLAKNLEAFATQYDTNAILVIPWTDGNLARSGEALSLLSPGSSNILNFTYSRLWYPETYNTGLTMLAVDLAAEEPLWSTAGNWQAGSIEYGTPGRPEVPIITVVALDDAAAEPADPAVLRFSRTEPVAESLTVDFALGGSATVGVDYEALGTSVTFDAGSAIAEITIEPIEDGVAEGPETVLVTLVAGFEYAIGSPDSATVTISEPNTPPTLGVIADQQVNELAELMVTAVGSDGDVPAQGLTYSLVEGPAGM